MSEKRQALIKDLKKYADFIDTGINQQDKMGEWLFGIGKQYLLTISKYSQELANKLQGKGNPTIIITGLAQAIKIASRENNDSAIEEFLGQQPELASFLEDNFAKLQEAATAWHAYKYQGQEFTSAADVIIKHGAEKLESVYLATLQELWAIVKNRGLKILDNFEHIAPLNTLPEEIGAHKHYLKKFFSENHDATETKFKANAQKFMRSEMSDNEYSKYLAANRVSEIFHPAVSFAHIHLNSFKAEVAKKDLHNGLNELENTVLHNLDGYKLLLEKLDKKLYKDPNNDKPTDNLEDFPGFSQFKLVLNDVINFLAKIQEKYQGAPIDVFTASKEILSGLDNGYYQKLLYLYQYARDLEKAYGKNVLTSSLLLGNEQDKNYTPLTDLLGIGQRWPFSLQLSLDGIAKNIKALNSINTNATMPPIQVVESTLQDIDKLLQNSEKIKTNQKEALAAITTISDLNSGNMPEALKKASPTAASNINALLAEARILAAELNKNEVDKLLFSINKGDVFNNNQVIQLIDKLYLVQALLIDKLIARYEKNGHLDQRSDQNIINLVDTISRNLQPFLNQQIKLNPTEATIKLASSFNKLNETIAATHIHSGGKKLEAVSSAVKPLTATISDPIEFYINKASTIKALLLSEDAKFFIEQDEWKEQINVLYKGLLSARKYAQLQGTGHRITNQKLIQAEVFCNKLEKYVNDLNANQGNSAEFNFGQFSDNSKKSQTFFDESTFSDITATINALLEKLIIVAEKSNNSKDMQAIVAILNNPAATASIIEQYKKQSSHSSNHKNKFIENLQQFGEAFSYLFQNDAIKFLEKGNLSPEVINNLDKIIIASQLDYPAAAMVLRGEFAINGLTGQSLEVKCKWLNKIMTGELPDLSNTDTRGDIHINVGKDEFKRLISEEGREIAVRTLLEKDLMPSPSSKEALEKIMEAREKIMTEYNKHHLEKLNADKVKAPLPENLSEITAQLKEASQHFKKENKNIGFAKLYIPDKILEKLKLIKNIITRKNESEAPYHQVSHSALNIHLDNLLEGTRALAKINTTAMKKSPEAQALKQAVKSAKHSLLQLADSYLTSLEIQRKHINHDCHQKESDVAKLRSSLETVEQELMFLETLCQMAKPANMSSYLDKIIAKLEHEKGAVKLIKVELDVRAPAKEALNDSENKTKTSTYEEQQELNDAEVARNVYNFLPNNTR